MKTLFMKYSRPGPRYTSYPTAPHWSDEIGVETYKETLRTSDPSVPLALYAHIPFCESLCYYCGCNIKITHDAAVSNPYVDALIAEIDSVSEALGSRRHLSQISWGGGTPTFLPVAEIQRLQRHTLRHFDLEDDAEVSIEIDPRVTSQEQLRTLRQEGFNRVSLGVQDFDPEVQQAVNRIQSPEMTQEMLEFCRSLGYRGINFDLIYGLPFQTLDRFTKTIDRVIGMRPDRIALYNYAHLPSLRPHQRILEKNPMPQVEERVAIFTLAYEQLLAAGYVAIGMDHFALPDDELSLALNRGTLYRNFMGYTVKRGTHLLGIGASAIGEINGGFFQNLREVGPYQRAVHQDGFATFRGCLLSDDDRRRKWIIQNLMCRFEVPFTLYRQQFDEDFEVRYDEELNALEELDQDGLLERDASCVRCTPLGRLFVRNAAMVFDSYLKNEKTTAYSKTL
ncbi:MAG: oxygen-independent coproporphyrinogen III oxidase [Bdellovibrionota bacterium]